MRTGLLPPPAEGQRGDGPCGGRLVHQPDPRRGRQQRAGGVGGDRCRRLDGDGLAVRTERRDAHGCAADLDVVVPQTEDFLRFPRHLCAHITRGERQTTI